MKTLLHFILLTLLCGIAYPLTVTGIGRAFFPEQISGSLVKKDGQLIGSHLLAQKFTQPHYFHPRPSAADYTTLPSGASNLGPTSAKLKKPSSSGSGLDPHITPQTALLQVPRVAQARGIPSDKLTTLVLKYTKQSFFGPPYVNVLELNLQLDMQKTLANYSAYP